jgi:tellurite resistance protein
MTLGLLVGRFGEFVREQHDEPQESTPQREFPDALTHIREVCSHHLIPLALLARADGHSDASEQKAILDYCAMLIDKSGSKLSEIERSAFRDYIAEFRPSLTQLEPALKQIEREPKDKVAMLFSAAVNVIEADGKRDESELKFLTVLNEDLAKLDHH